MKKRIIILVLALSFMLAPVFQSGITAAEKQKPKSGRQILEEGKRSDKQNKAEAKRIKKMYKEGKISKTDAKKRLSKIDSKREKSKQKIKAGKHKMKEGR